MREIPQEVCARIKNELTSFQYLSREDIPAIAPYLECRQVQAGEVLWQEGDPCDYLAFVIEGKIDIKKETEFPGKQVIVGLYGRGSVVGEMCILDHTPRAVTAVALEESSLLLLTRESFERLLQDNLPVGAKLLKGMLLAVSIRLRNSYERLAAIF